MLKSCLMLFISLSCFLFAHSAIALCLLWFFAGVLYVMTLCRCGSFASFMFIKELFPEVMAVSYLLKWLNAFLLLVMSEIVVLLFLSRTQLTKTEVLLLGLKLVGFQYTTQYARIALCFNADGQRRIYAFLCPGRHVEFTPYLCLESDSTQRILPVP